MLSYRSISKTRMLLLGVALILVAACGERLSREELVQRTQQSLADGDLNAALIDVKSALQQSPQDPEVRALYGEIYLQQRNMPAAAEQFRRSLDTNFTPAIGSRYAETLLSGGQSEELLDLSNEGYFASIESNADYLATRAMAEVTLGDYFTAMDTLEIAKTIDPKNPIVRRADAVLLAQHAGDLPGAKERLSELVADFPEDADAWSLYASVLRASGEIEEAASAFAKAAESNMYRLGDRLNHLSLLVATEALDEASIVLEELESILPDDPRVNYAQARIALAE